MLQHTCVTTPSLILIKQDDASFTELRKKLRLENTFLRELRPAFAQILRDFRTSVASFGRAQDASQYESRFKGLLQNHYDRVQRAFKGDVIEDNGGKVFLALIIKQDEERLNTLVDLALLEWRNQNSQKKASIITATNQRQMDQAIIDARQQLQEDGEETTPVSLSLSATTIVGRQFAIRSNTIAQTETQESAEATKQIEATVTGGKQPFNLGPGFVEEPEKPLNVTKTWLTVGDDRVRPTHVATNGTTLPENGIYSVGSSRLRFPGDTSLLASAGETINCRCSNRFELKSQS